jgi:hypothetical protein
MFGTPNFGRIFTAKNLRQMQFGLRVAFRAPCPLLNISANSARLHLLGDRTDDFGDGRDRGRRDSMIRRQTVVLGAAAVLTIVSATAVAQQQRRVSDQQVQDVLNLIDARMSTFVSVSTARSTAASRSPSSRWTRAPTCA